MTKQEQVKEILEVIKHCGDYTKRDCAECDYRLYGECKNQKQCEAEALYNEGYRKVPFGATVLAPEERNDEIREMHEILECRDELIAKVGILGSENYDLKAENEQLKAKLETRQNYAVQDFAKKLKSHILAVMLSSGKVTYDNISNIKVIFYYINRQLNDTFGLDEPLNAANQLLAEPELVEKYNLKEFIGEVEE